VASDWVARKAGGRARQLIDGVEKEGWRFVAFVRLVPLFPFNLVNYALGLTRIRLRDYALASYLFMSPGALAYAYLGYAGREALGGADGVIQKGLVALGLLAAVAFLPRLLRRWRAAQGPRAAGGTLSATELKARLDRGEEIGVLMFAARQTSPVRAATCRARRIFRSKNCRSAWANWKLGAAGRSR
jgi:hypothetical protein